MAITYHAGRRLQGNETTYTNVTTSSNGSTGNGSNNSSGFSQVTGKIGYGFSQSSGNYAINNQSWGLGNDGWSFNFWCIPQSASGNDYYLQFTETAGWRNVFYMYNAQTENGGGFQPRFIDDIGTNMGLTSVALTNGSWNMITVTWTPTEDAYKVYKNGVLLYTETYTATNAGNFGTPNRNWYLGNYNGTTASTYASRANGMDEWSWWTAPLTQADITELYNGGTGIKAKDLTSANKIKLKVYYDFEDSVNGTLTNQAPTTATYTAQDTKPTNVQAGSRYEETNTRKMYHYTDPLILDEDFDYATQTLADASWITNATNVRVNVSTNKLGFAWTSSTPNQQCYYDLGASVSETEWVLRFVVNYSTLTTAGTHLPIADIKLSGSSSSANYPLAASQISFQLSAGSGSANVYFKSTNTSGGGEVSPTAVAWNPTIGTNYYVEMIRTSATHATLNVRTGSHSGTMVTNFPMNLTTINSGCTGLRYIRLQQYPNSFGNITGTLDDLKFYNGATSTDNIWKELGT